MPFYLSPIGNAQVYLASNGQPANGGFINTYLAGTTTPAATFTSISGAVNNTNPIVLTPAGMAPQPIWLTGGQAYKFIITDALGNQIGVTEDNVRGIGDGSAGGGIINPMTTLGDIITGGVAGAPQRLGIGTTNQVLTVNAGAPAWEPVTVTGTPALYTSINSTGANIQYQGNVSSGGTLGSSVGAADATFMFHFTSGSAAGSRVFTTSNIGSINYAEATDNAAGSFGWTPSGSYAGLFVGDSNGGANTPNVGGFTIDIYAGIGQQYFSASNPGWFIGISSNIGAVSTQFSTTLNDAVGIIVDSTAATLVSTWSWVARRGSGAAAITAFSSPPSVGTGQLFAVRIAYPANSDAGLLSVSQLTAPGTWTSLLANAALTGIGPAKGTRVGPYVYGKNFVNSGNTNGVIFHRSVGVMDQFNVPSAF